jgi:AAA15 family ATPase/GTPase
MIYVDMGFPEMLPAAVAGAGIQRLLSILLAIHAARRGIVLVDEIENGFYHAKMMDIWKAIAEAARTENVQVFATTHSMECLRAAHRAFSENPPHELRVLRLQRERDGQTGVVTLDEKRLQVAIEQNWEVR